MNRLSATNSPYLLQHAHNPVDWYPWGSEAFEKAKQEDKPIFLSIGYAACHWCHVMAHESFEDPDTARIMNEYFVNIKVDREERPDIDNVYMNSVVAMTGQGGWPTSVFLTPDGLPFYGGTYFPPQRRYNMPAFREVLLAVAKAWREDRDRILNTANQIKDHMAALYPIEISRQPSGLEELDRAALALAQTYDWTHGGWGNAPKFPQPMAIEYLLKRASRGDKLALDISTHALRAMAKGGMYDVIGGGFARYSTDNNWLIPHFEKMLYDNALLVNAYLHAYLLTGDPFFKKICEETMNFIIRDMMSPEGGFFSSLDADSEGGEGDYYLWTVDEILDTLSDEEDRELFLSAYDISETGNFQGKIVLQRRQDDETLIRNFGLDQQVLYEKLSRIHSLLLLRRQRRPSPQVDDKILASWNGLVLLSLSEVGRYLGGGYGDVAMRNFDFINNHLIDDNAIFRSYRKGKVSIPGFLEDYASLILACLSLYQTTHDNNFYMQAKKICESMIANFTDANHNFFDTGNTSQDLFVRPKEVQDNALPSGSALATMALLQLSAYEGNRLWFDMAMSLISSVVDLSVRYPVNFSYWLCAMDFALNPHFEVAILGDPHHDSFSKLVDVLWSKYRPNVILAVSSFPPDQECPPLLKDRHPVDLRPTAFVCQNFVCNNPVVNPSELQALLEP